MTTKLEDTYRLDTLVLSVVNKTGGALLEVRFRDEDMAVDVLQRLKHKYAGLEGDETGEACRHLFTLYFTNSKRKSS